MSNMSLILRYAFCFWLLILCNGTLNTTVTDTVIHPSASVWSTNYSGLLYSITFCGGGDLFVVLSSFQLSTSLDGQHIIQTNNSYFNGVHHSYNKTCGIVRIYAIQGLVNNREWNLTYGGLGKSTNITLWTQNCSRNTSMGGPMINASSYTYNKPGQFVCPAGQELFYSNSTPGITNTICQNDATWFGDKGLECWGGSGVDLHGNFSGTEGQSLILNCMYNESVYPLGEQYNISVGNNTETVAWNSSFHLNLTRELHGKFVHCQPITKYTKVRPEEGLSKRKQLNVAYKPYGITMSKACSYQCQISFYSNPPPVYGTLTTLKKQGDIKESDFGTINAIEGRYLYTFQSPEWPYGMYTFKVANSIGNTSFNFTFAESTTIPTATSTTQPSIIPTLVGAAAAGAVVIIGCMLALKLYCKRKISKTDSDEKEERDNPLYGTSNGADINANKKNAKIKSKELKTNVAYQPSPESPDAIEEAYGPVNGGKKEEKLNILYEAAGPSTRSDETYARVDKNKKKQKLKPMKVNVAYIPTPENPDAPEEAYAEVNKTKKIKDKQKKGKQRNDTADTSSQPGTSKTDEYAVVIKKVKNPNNKNGESSGGATYAVLSKPKKKKEPPPPEPPSDSDDDPYAEVELHGQEE